MISQSEYDKRLQALRAKTQSILTDAPRAVATPQTARVVASEQLAAADASAGGDGEVPLPAAVEVVMHDDVLGLQPSDQHAGVAAVARPQSPPWQPHPQQKPQPQQQQQCARSRSPMPVSKPGHPGADMAQPPREGAIIRSSGAPARSRSPRPQVGEPRMSESEFDWRLEWYKAGEEQQAYTKEEGAALAAMTPDERLAWADEKERLLLSELSHRRREQRIAAAQKIAADINRQQVADNLSPIVVDTLGNEGNGPPVTADVAIDVASGAPPAATAASSPADAATEAALGASATATAEVSYAARAAPPVATVATDAALALVPPPAALVDACDAVLAEPPVATELSPARAAAAHAPAVGQMLAAFPASQASVHAPAAMSMVAAAGSSDDHLRGAASVESSHQDRQPDCTEADASAYAEKLARELGQLASQPAVLPDQPDGSNGHPFILKAVLPPAAPQVPVPATAATPGILAGAVSFEQDLRFQT